MVGLALVGLVDADVGVVHVEAEILHVAEHVALAVLRARTAEMRAEAEIRSRRFAHRPAFDGQAAQQQEAAAVQDLVADACLELGPERGQRKVTRCHRRDVSVACHQRLGGMLDLGDLRARQPQQPVVAPGHLGAVPGRGAGLFRRQVDRLGAHVSHGNLGAKRSSLVDRRKLSVAFTSAARMPGSSALWPASGTTT